jgi:hypothetical protein
MGDTVVTNADGTVSVVTSAPITTDTVSSSGQNVYTNSAGQVVTAPTSASASLTNWLNNNTGLAVGIAVAVVGLLFVAKGRR